MEVPHLELVGRISPGVVVDFDKMVWFTGRWGGTVQRRRQHPTQVGIGIVKIEIHHAGWLSEEHFIALKNHCTLTSPSHTIAELVGGHIIPVRPDPQLRIIIHYSIAVKKLIAIPGAGWIWALADGDTFVVWLGYGELADHPAVGQVIVHHDRIAVVAGFASATKALPDRFNIYRSIQGNAGLVPDLQRQVYHLDNMVRTDGNVWVGRQNPVPIGYTFKIST